MIFQNCLEFYFWNITHDIYAKHHYKIINHAISYTYNNTEWRSCYVMLEWWQNFWIPTNHGPGNIPEKKETTLSCAWLHCTQEQVLLSFKKASGRLCHERLLRSRSNMTSHFFSLWMYDFFFDSLTCYCAGIRVPFIHFLSIDNIFNLLFLTQHI